MTVLSGLLYYTILFLYPFSPSLRSHLRNGPLSSIHCPWFSISLNDFWSSRRYQIFRHLFIASSSVPSVYIFGRLGGVVGVFLASGLLHYFGMLSMGMSRGTNSVAIVGFFFVMGLGTMAECGWNAVTAKRVGGVAGWAWSMIWVLGWQLYYVLKSKQPALNKCYLPYLKTYPRKGRSDTSIRFTTFVSEKY